MTTRIVFALCVCLCGCVTQTERLPYRRYASPPQDESILDEVRRELGWQPSPAGDPFYTRAVRGITHTVSGWFRSDDASAATDTQERLRQQFEEERQQALQRLRTRQAQERAQD
ncbi:MAG: hypothetical protein NZ578_11910 [Candidatus Binatia bacterium]|nr:hypothetical protein [Candidatus Binatia bacterium]